MNKKISILMSTYNEPAVWVKESVDSMLGQTYSNIELVVVCDNPKNSAVVELLHTIKEKDNRVVLHINEENRGLIYSLNKAIELSTGEYIARMDADDISLPTRLEKQLAYLEENNLDLCGCNSVLFSEKGEFGSTNKLNHHNSLEKLMIGGDIGVIHPTFLAKREVFVNSGGYDSLAIHAEDMEFIARILSMGFKLGNHPEVLFRCRFSENSVTRENAYKLYSTTRNVNKAYQKFKKSGQYVFSNHIEKNKNIEERFNKSKLLITKARESLSQKKYMSCIFSLFSAFLYSPEILYHSFKIKYVARKLKQQEVKSG